MTWNVQNFTSSGVHLTTGNSGEKANHGKETVSKIHSCSIARLNGTIVIADRKPLPFHSIKPELLAQQANSAKLFHESIGKSQIKVYGLK